MISDFLLMFGGELLMGIYNPNPKLPSRLKVRIFKSQVPDMLIKLFWKINAK